MPHSQRTQPLNWLIPRKGLACREKFDARLNDIKPKGDDTDHLGMPSSSQPLIIITTIKLSILEEEHARAWVAERSLMAGWHGKAPTDYGADHSDLWRSPRTQPFTFNLHLPLNNRGDRWGTTHDFTTSFLHSPLGLGEAQACPLPNVVSPPLPLPALSSSPCHCSLQNGFGETWRTGNMCIPPQFASLYGSQVFVWSNCLLDLGTNFLIW